MIDETRARFLSSIAAQLDIERVAEAHLFPAIRQGGMESGVAVLALDLKREAGPADDAVAESAEPPETPSAADDAPTGEGEQVSVPDAAPLADDASGDVDDDGPYADADAGVEAEDESGTDAADDADDDPAVAARPAPRRFTVYSARYRHTLKGPDRGKWEVSVTEEADAPLLTVDAVVRGVQRRSGDVDEIVRMSGDEIRSVVTVVATAAAGAAVGLGAVRR